MWPISSVSVSFAPSCITFCWWLLTWFVTSWPKQNPCMICVCRCHPRLACASLYVSMPSFPSLPEFPRLACLVALLHLNATLHIAFQRQKMCVWRHPLDLCVGLSRCPFACLTNTIKYAWWLWFLWISYNSDSQVSKAGLGISLGLTMWVNRCSPADYFFSLLNEIVIV